METRVLTAINEIVGAKRAAIKHPSHALSIEVFEKFKKEELPEVKKTINKLITNNIIRFGRTLNDVWLLPR